MVESWKFPKEKIDIWSLISIKYGMTEVKDTFQIEGICAH